MKVSFQSIGEDDLTTLERQEVEAKVKAFLPSDDSLSVKLSSGKVIKTDFRVLAIVLTEGTMNQLPEGDHRIG